MLGTRLVALKDTGTQSPSKLSWIPILKHIIVNTTLYLELTENFHKEI